VLCVIQPITGLGYYTDNLERKENMLSSVQKMNKTQAKLCGRETWPWSRYVALCCRHKTVLRDRTQKESIYFYCNT